MKKLAPFFILMVLLSSTIPTTAHAQFDEVGFGATAPPLPPLTNPGQSVLQTLQTPNQTQQAAINTAVAQSQQSNPAPTRDDIGCSLSDGGRGVAICVSNFVYFIMVGVGSWAATICAYLFDYAVQLSLTSASYALDFIAIGWGMVRDIANMSFLFILVYIAFKIMFQAETAGTIRMLTWVVVVALLVNFSFLLTRIAVDAGNIVAVQFYNAIQAPLISDRVAGTLPGSTLTNAAVSSGAANGNTKDLTAAIMNALNVQALTNTQNFQNFVSNPGNSPMSILIILSVIYIMTGIALFIVASSFLFVGIKFVLRIIALWFLIIGSPLAFIAAIFRGKEGGSQWFSLWLSYLIKFSFYPAIFLGMFWIQTIFMNRMGSGALFNSLANGLGTTSFQSIAATAANVGIRLAFIVATLWLSLKVADWAVHEMSRATGLAQGFLTGGYNNFRRGLDIIRDTRSAGRLGANRLATAGAPVGGFVQSQANAATRSGVNSMLWRSINRAVGGTNTATPRSQTLSGALETFGLTRRSRAAGGLFKAAEKEKTAAAGQNQSQQAPQQQPGQAQPQQAPQAQQAPQTQSAPQQAPQQQGQTANRPTRAPGTTPIANQAARAGATPQVMNTSAQQAIESLRAGAQRRYRENPVGNAEPVKMAAQYMNIGNTKEYDERIAKLKEQGDEIKHLVKEQAKKLSAASVAGSLHTEPDMSKSSTARVEAQRAAAPTQEHIGEIKESIQNLNTTVRNVTNALKNNGPMPERIVIQQNVPAPTPTGTPPAAPTAARPAQKADNDNGVFRPANPKDYPYDQAAE